MTVRENNFDLIRLFAAFQVAIVHAITHLKVSSLGFLATSLEFLPGVPIFFVISGFLISMSWEKAPSLQQYFWNRVLRIYPAMWICLIFSIVIFTLSGVRPDSTSNFLNWILAQISFVQFYNPDFLRNFGVGVINGSLWTIPVELQFYTVLPLLALMANKHKRSYLVWVVFLANASIVMILLRLHFNEPENIISKIIIVSLLPYLFYFLIGVISRIIYENHPFLFRGKALFWFGGYLAWIIIQIISDIKGAKGNHLNIVSIFLLGAAVISMAFTYTHASGLLLKGNDISYGMYIYHMPIINFLINNQLTGIVGLLSSFVITIIFSIGSWRFIERPALNLKKYSLRQDK